MENNVNIFRQARAVFYGFMHYYSGVMLTKKEYGWVKAQWHFLLASEYYSSPTTEKTRCRGILSAAIGRGMKRCNEYLNLIDEKNREREDELERKTAEICLQRRMRREIEKHDGDMSQVNLALFLTSPERR